jgi:hypothetical protein
MPHAAIAPVRRRATGGEEEGDARHVAADVELAQPAHDDGSEEEGDAERVVRNNSTPSPLRYALT